MKTKLTLYPTELNTEPLAERLIGIKSESERAQVIRNLLVAQASGVSALPPWFLDLPKHLFDNLIRGQTTRITFSRADPAFKQLIVELEGLERGQQSAHLKSILQKMVETGVAGNSTASNPATPITTPSAPPIQMTGADFSPEPDNTQEISDKSRKFRSGAAGFKI